MLRSAAALVRCSVAARWSPRIPQVYQACERTGAWGVKGRMPAGSSAPRLVSLASLDGRVYDVPHVRNAELKHAAVQRWREAEQPVTPAGVACMPRRPHYNHQDERFFAAMNNIAEMPLHVFRRFVAARPKTYTNDTQVGLARCAGPTYASSDDFGRSSRVHFYGRQLPAERGGGRDTALTVAGFVTSTRASSVRRDTELVRVSVGTIEWRRRHAMPYMGDLRVGDQGPERTALPQFPAWLGK